MSDVWKTYRTRFLVRAKQLAQPLVFTDSLGREHRGRAGDYIVQSSEGAFRIANREIFEDVYVTLEDAPGTTADPSPAGPRYPAPVKLSA
jgi:hypothetical protein